MRNDTTALLPRPVDTHIPAGSLVTVTIGRNVGSAPMTGNEWADFKSLVHSYLRSFAGTVFGPFEGVGEWDGIVEESAVLTAITNYPANPAAVDAQLRVFCDDFKQDAIAWSYGPARLAERA